MNKFSHEAYKNALRITCKKKESWNGLRSVYRDINVEYIAHKRINVQE
jgi:hypothetical protein